MKNVIKTILIIMIACLLASCAKFGSPAIGDMQNAEESTPTGEVQTGEREE